MSRHKQNGRDQTVRPIWRDHNGATREMGLALERRVESILIIMVAEGKVESFVRHSANSPEDHAGKDFTVVKNGRSRSFGVTTSSLHALVCESNHHLPVLHVPNKGGTEILLRKFIKALFREPPQALST